MVPNPTDPNPRPHPKSDPTDGPSTKGSSGVHYDKGHAEAKPITFLGMYFDSDDAKKLWNVIIQTVNDQISQDQSKAVQAIKKFGKASTGDEDWDSD